jgi:hypothetical protein
MDNMEIHPGGAAYQGILLGTASYRARIMAEVRSKLSTLRRDQGRFVQAATIEVGRINTKSIDFFSAVVIPPFPAHGLTLLP